MDIAHSNVCTFVLFVLVLTVVMFLGDTNNFVIHATGTKQFALFPLLYFPLVVGIGLHSNCLKQNANAFTHLSCLKATKTDYNIYNTVAS